MAYFVFLFFVLMRGISTQDVWQCSDLTNGVYYLPGFHWTGWASVFNSRSDLGDSHRSTRSYVYSIPSTQLNCTGTITVVEFCYKIRNDEIDNAPQNGYLVFNLSTLNQSGSFFTVNDSIPVNSRPSRVKCMGSGNNNMDNYYCCDMMRLNGADQFQLPAENFAFGITTPSPMTPPNLQRFESMYRLDHFQKEIPLLRGMTYDLGDAFLDELRALRFHLTPLPTISPSTAVPDPPHTSLPTALPDTLSSDMPTVLTTSLETSSSTLGPPPNTGLNGNTGSSNQQSAKVGGAIGGVIAMVLVVIVVVLLLILLVLYRARRLPKETGEHRPAIDNIIYGNRESDSLTMDGVKSGNEYSEIGPSASNRYCSSKRRQVGAEEHEYEIAQSSKGNLPNPAEYEAVQFKSRMVPNLHPAQNQPEYDDIYVVPASDVDGLYAQLEEILTDSVCRDNISLGDMLGSGQFGEVYKGVWVRSHDNMEVAIKTLKEGSSDDDKVKFLQEAAIMGQFKHPNVVTMYGVVTDGEPILLVLEMLKKGDLRNYLLSMRTDKEGVSPEVDDHELLNYCRQVASGMAYLSNKSFVHRDLAARNILVSDDRICKIADFGMSRDLADENYYVSHGGLIPVKWTAPEALHYKKYSTASDVWSFGAVMYEIWSVGHKPFEGMNNGKVIQLLNSGYRLPPPPGCPRAIYCIMISCWHPRANGRPNFSEVSAQLSASTSKLLHWSHVDKSGFPEASRLGANLASAEKLYEDMQLKYKKT